MATPTMASWRDRQSTSRSASDAAEIDASMMRFGSHQTPIAFMPTKRG